MKKKTNARQSAAKEAEFELEKDAVFFLNALERHAYMTLLLVALFLAVALPRLAWPKTLLEWAGYLFVVALLVAVVANALWSISEKKKFDGKKKAR